MSDGNEFQQPQPIDIGAFIADRRDHAAMHQEYHMAQQEALRADVRNLFFKLDPDDLYIVMLIARSSEGANEYRAGYAAMVLEGKHGVSAVTGEKFPSGTVADLFNAKPE